MMLFLVLCKMLLASCSQFCCINVEVHRCSPIIAASIFLLTPKSRWRGIWPASSLFYIAAFQSAKLFKDQKLMLGQASFRSCRSYCTKCTGRGQNFHDHLHGPSDLSVDYTELDWERGIGPCTVYGLQPSCARHFETASYMSETCT